jgi:uncharacterized OB-fold protein
MLAPEPVASAHDEPYWQAARDGKFLLQRCKVTGRCQFPPRGHSMATGGTELEWVESAGTGNVYSFTVVERSFYENLAAPFVLAIVELDEGPRLTTHLVDVDRTRVRIGMRVKAEFRSCDQRALPLLVFVPA